MKIKRVSKNWLQKYFGLPKEYLDQFEPPFYATEGGRATWDFDRLNKIPGYENFEGVHRSSSYTYWAKRK